MSGPLYSLLQRHRNRVQIFINWIDWVWCLIKGSELLLTHVHLMLVVVWRPVVLLAVVVVAVLMRIMTSSVLTSITVSMLHSVICISLRITLSVSVLILVV